ncbi:MAG: DPP IV N-terminal domain-containing protein [Planctomycetota bacterium]
MPSLSKTLAALTLPCLLLATAAPGCSPLYNGAWGMSSAGKQQAIAYRQFKTKQAQQLNRAAQNAARNNPHQLRPPASTPQTDPADAGQVPVSFPDANSPGTAPAAPQNPSPQPPSARLPLPAPPSNQVQFDGGTSGSAPESTGLLLNPGLPTLYGAVPGQAPSPSTAMLGQANARQLSFTTEGADFDVTTDPTGTRLIYASTRHRNTADLYMQSVGGSAVTQLTSSPANDVMPAVSPDGQRIAFASDRSGNWDLYLMDLAGGPPIQLTTDSAADLHPSFSPDGSQLVYSSFAHATGQWQLVLININNPNIKRYLGPGLFPAWSPIDNTIAFQRARQRGTRWFSVWTIKLNGGEATQPTEVAASANAAIIAPAWSPDGQHLVFCTVLDPHADNSQSPNTADLWMMSADGRQRTRLTEGLHANLQPVWAPTQTLYFISNRSRTGNQNIWALNPKPTLMTTQANPTDPNQPTVMAPTP